MLNDPQDMLSAIRQVLARQAFFVSLGTVKCQQLYSISKASLIRPQIHFQFASSLRCELGAAREEKESSVIRHVIAKNVVEEEQNQKE